MKNPLGARWLRWVLGSFAGLILLIALAWFGLILYARAHRQEILAKVSDALGKELQGDIKIGNMDPSIFRSFPNLALVLYDVSLRDSLWKVHKHSLLEAKEVEVRVDVLGLLNHKTDIKMVKALHGSMFFYVDSNGYSNTYMLSRKDTTTKTGQKKPAIIRAFALEDMHFWFVNKVKEKLFHIEIRSLRGEMSEIANVLRIDLLADAQVHEFNFNVSRGSYLHNQKLNLDLVLRLHRNEKRLEIEDQAVRIGGTPILVGGNFFFDRKPAAFDLRFHSPSVKYKTATTWVSPNISKKLNNFDFEKPISLEVRATGIMQYRAIPLVRIKYQMRDNTLHAKNGDVSNLNFDGTFTNEAVQGLGHNDENSQLGMFGLKGTWNDIDFQCDTILLNNLLRPYVQAHIVASPSAKTLNNLVDENVMVFKEGKISCNINYKGGILASDQTPRQLNGQVQIKELSFKYVPRDMDLVHTNATLIFKKEDLFIRDVQLQCGKSTLLMEGEALNLLRFYFADPGRVAVNWKLRSPMVNIEDFLTFTARRMSSDPGKKTRKTVHSIGRQLATVAGLSTVHFDARINKLNFKKFSAESVIAIMDITPGRLQLQELKIVDGAGVLTLRGQVQEGNPHNPFGLKVDISNADLPRLFRYFDNFGQDGIKEENLQGNINANVDVSGFIYNGQITKNSLHGTVQYEWRDGALVNFAPLEKIGKYVFKKRNLSNVEIKSMKGEFLLDRDKITIPPTEIQTTAVNMKIQGIYGLYGGTDIFVEIPLRNPEKDEPTTDVGRFIHKTGVVYLRVQNEKGDDLKIGWDPAKKGEKSTDEKLNNKKKKKKKNKDKEES